MPLIETVEDLFSSGAHWTIQTALERGYDELLLQDTLANRFGDTLVATRATIQAAATIVRRGMDTAGLLKEGFPVSPETVPVAPLVRPSQRYYTAGIVTLRNPDLGEPGRPLSTTLPFQVETATLPLLEEIARQIEQAIQEAEDAFQGNSPKGTKKREKAAYIRRRGEPIEYEITPLFVFRTY